jgi:hypothetical protein
VTKAALDVPGYGVAHGDGDGLRLEVVVANLNPNFLGAGLTCRLMENQSARHERYCRNRRGRTYRHPCLETHRYAPSYQ